MITKRFIGIMIVVCLFAVLFSETVTSQGDGVTGDVATLTVAEEQIEWQPLVDYSSAMLTISGPDGNRRLEFDSGESIILPLQDKEAQALAEGQYVYELRLAPVLSQEAQAAMDAATTPEEREQVMAELQAAGELPLEPLVQTGGFVMRDSKITLVASSSDAAASDSDQPPVTEDQVVADDMIVRSLCAGGDCADGEDFNYRTVIIKENNTRLIFEDTSDPAGSFPANDWELMANESGAGQDLFALVDSTGGNRLFVTEAGARNNALYIDSNGDIGLGTSAPDLDIHATSSNTPAIRLEQTADGGWGPQTWDIGANEANFFVRDLSQGGGVLPFRIKPGAPSNSVYIQASGNVGVGTSSPDTRLHVSGDDATFRVENTTEVTPTVTLDLDANGNLTLSGLLTEASDEAVKENFTPVDTAEVLQGIVGLNLTTWNYRADQDDVRHLGPMAQEFYATFGLGADNRHIAGLDVNGVTLAGIQELYGVVQAQEAKIESLEQENEELNERLMELEEAVDILLEAQQEQE